MVHWDENGAIVAAIAKQHQRMAARGYRFGVVISGAQSGCLALARTVVEAVGAERVHWHAGVGDKAEGRGLLGQEVDALVFDAHEGFDPDAFGALAGSLRGGGLLLLLTPPLAQWPRLPDPACARIAPWPHRADDVGGRFLARLVRVIREHQGPALLVIEEGHEPEIVPGELPLSQPLPVPADAACRTLDQQQAVEAVMRVVQGHRRRPAVLISDRGRGKSAAFGIAAARLLEAGTRRILVTGPRLAAVEALFEQAARLLLGARVARGRIRWEGGVLEFLAPDELLRQPQQADLLLVDEAAAIPAPLLEALLERHARIAFATTVHGYEGTGRGFALRFRQVLDRLTPGWRELRLETPVRWAPGDPLEAFVSRALLLDAEVPDLPAASVTEAEVERVDAGRLAGDEALLGQIFGLLVTAHYRTRPFDLRQMLDAPGWSVWVQRCGEQVVGTALVAEEGGFGAATAEAVWRGETRPHGHLLPESLAAHVGLREAPRLRGARIIRIAVHPALQRRGLGRRLLQTLVEAAAAGGGDYIGASFGITPGLLAFWRQAGFLPVRVSFRRGAASGTHSAMLLRGVGPAGQHLVTAARQRFAVHFPAQLADPLKGLEPGLAVRLLEGVPVAAPVLDTRARDDLEAFAHGRRLYEAVMGSLRPFVLHALAGGGEGLAPGMAELLMARVVQQRPWAELASLLGISGRAEGVQCLRSAVRLLAARNSDPPAGSERKDAGGMP